MEKRKDSLGTIKLCRFCLTQDGPIQCLYAKAKRPKSSIPLSLKILSCVSVEVFPSDKMPSYICNRCRFFMNLFYEYKQICRQADESILHYVKSGSALEPIVWPSSLVKSFRQGANVLSDGEVLKVEGGAMVEVLSQYASDSEDGENVYNVKIGDGSDDGSSACVKVVTNNEKKEIKKNTKQSKGFSSVSKLARHVRTHAGERPYPCKYCDKSFTKSHHYTRHVRLKHHETIRTARGPFGMTDQYRCDQCEDSFTTQDDLIYHSAIHATQNLTCPLCQEKFENVDAVTAHIKSHVNGMEFMCDFCELVFTSREKLDYHLSNAHAEEIRSAQESGVDESSMEVEGEDGDDENIINVKDEGDHMVVEINKPENFLLLNSQSELEGTLDEKMDNTVSEESESETTYTELSNVDTLTLTNPESQVKTVVQANLPVPKVDVTKNNEDKTASILRKAEEVKRKVEQAPETAIEKKERPNNKNESNTTGGNDKSLRLLEKELQELQRTNSRNESKTPSRPVESLRSSSRRPQLHTSTPKVRSEEKKITVTTRVAIADKKVPEKRAVKENKEPKDAKVNTSGTTKEDKDTKANTTTKEDKEKETTKSAIKNGASDRSNTEDTVRRSTRPSKVKDYAKMIRDNAPTNSDDDSEDENDEEYIDNEKFIENRQKIRRVNVKPQPKPVVKPPGLRKRGRPRKDKPLEVPPKVRKEDQEDEDENKDDKSDSDDNSNEKGSAAGDTLAENDQPIENADTSKTSTEQKKPNSTLVSATGQTLKKIPIKSLPPGIKPLPLPANARPVGPELCEMQIGKKVVKVQKIVMTKAEVEAMAKKGLVEMKDGTMVLKQGIKIPTDPVAIKSTLVGEDAKESPKKEKGTPMRCELANE